ncbi:MAG: HAMP domain-containing histidine kinase [Bacteroidetes bacterium]|nr:HAMP domain-containing histidine kinase [Bacteroidota bacterium]
MRLLPRPTLLRITGWLVLVCSMVTLSLALTDVFTPTDALLDRVSQHTRRKLSHKVARLQEKLAAGELPGGAEVSDPICLLYDRRGQLVHWNSNRYVPTYTAVKTVLGKPGATALLSDHHRRYWAIGFAQDSLRGVCLLPLLVSSSIRNEYLADYVFLGKWSPRPGQDFPRFHTTTDRRFSGIEVLSPEGAYLFTVQIPDTDYLRRDGRKWALFSFALALVLGACYALLLLQARWGRGWRATGVWLGALLLIRLAFHLLRFPGSWASLDVFSSQVLALNWLNPSLGDLTLNMLLLFLTAYQLYLLVPQLRLAQWLQRWTPLSWYVYNLLYFILSLGLYLYFFYFFGRIVNNSKIYFEFSDLSRLDGYSYLVFLNIALFLFALFLLQYLLAGISLLLKYRTQGRQLQWPLLVYFALFLCTAYLWLPGFSWPEGVIFAAWAISVHIFRGQAGGKLRFSLIQAATLFGLFAVITNFAVSRSLEESRLSKLSHYGQARFSRQQDPFTEFYFDEVVENIREDTSLREPDSTLEPGVNPYQELVNRIINNHLANAIKHYDFRVFVFNAFNRRLDSQTDQNPFPLLRNRALMEKGKSHSKYLYRIPSNKSFTREIYVGRFDLYSATPMLGKLIIQVELYPKSIIGGKLYPQLLLDASLKRKLNVPQGFEIGIYSNGRLVQRIDNTLQRKGEAFPLDLQAGYAHITRDTLLYNNPEYYELVAFHGQNRVIVARAPRRSFFNQLTAVSFLFYFFVLLYLLYRLPEFAQRFRWAHWREFRTSFIARIEFFLVLITLLPLILIWSLSTSLLNRFFEQEIYLNLQQNLENAADVLEGKEGFLYSLQGAPLRPNELSANRHELSEISNLLGSDLNVYDTEGHLRGTTRPRLYQASLSSLYMNPEPLAFLREGKAPFTIVRENIGELSYLSGYIPIYDGSFVLRGFLNIPYLAQQDVLDFQVEKFLAYLINVYVFIIMVLVLVGLFLSRTLTNPLTLLRHKLDQTNLGLAYEPIEWDSKDEIGRIIQSYNHMLQKLAESEQKLAKRQRDFAWTEMARQVAHEIKNPLTPMKLSIQHLARTLQTADDEKRRQVVEKVCQTLLAQIESLTAIANSFGDFARMPSSQPEALSLQKLLSEVHALYEGTEGITCTLQVPAEDVYVWADPNQLNRVLVNLVQNAIQAMDKPRGQVDIRLYTVGGRAVVEVKDNGTGVPEDIQGRIFEPNFSTKTSGMGLGLAITKRMVEAMDGDIRFESTVGEGTRFLVSIPLHAQPA